MMPSVASPASCCNYYLFYKCQKRETFQVVQQLFKQNRSDSFQRKHQTPAFILDFSSFKPLPVFRIPLRCSVAESSPARDIPSSLLQSSRQQQQKKVAAMPSVCIDTVRCSCLDQCTCRLFNCFLEGSSTILGVPQKRTKYFISTCRIPSYTSTILVQK